MVPKAILEGLDVAIMLTGLPASVSRTLNDHVLTFLDRVRKTERGPLRIGDVDAFYCRAFEYEWSLEVLKPFRESGTSKTFPAKPDHRRLSRFCDAENF